MAFDGIVTKSIISELQNIVGSKIDKIYEPDRNTIILGLYLQGKNYALNICIDAHNCRVNLTTHSKINPLITSNLSAGNSLQRKVSPDGKSTKG